MNGYKIDDSIVLTTMQEEWFLLCVNVLKLEVLRYFQRFLPPHWMTSSDSREVTWYSSEINSWEDVTSCDVLGTREK